MQHFASGSELITVAIRRVNITNPHEENLLDYFQRYCVKCKTFTK